MAGLAKKSAARAAAIVKDYVGSSKDMLEMLEELRNVSKNKGFRKTLRRISKAVKRSESKLTKAIGKVSKKAA